LVARTDLSPDLIVPDEDQGRFLGMDDAPSDVTEITVRNGTVAGFRAAPDGSSGPPWRSRQDTKTE